MSPEKEQQSLAEISSDIKQANLEIVAGALLLACDILEEKALGMSQEEIEFVSHARELANEVRK